MYGGVGGVGVGRKEENPQVTQCHKFPTDGLDNATKYVTGFDKIQLPRTRTEIQFIA